VGWNIKDVTDLGFVSPDNYGGPDIICHRNANPVSQSAKVEAGGTVELQWTEWPESHHGPVIDYLANCRGSCADVDKTALKFNKIDEAGLYSNSTIPWTVGRYASDKLIADGHKWTVKIPSYVAPGNYVLRHEVIALHSAYDPNGAQNYPQCINLEITGQGTDDLSSGTPGQSLYKADEPGILTTIYQDINYIIPGPPLYRSGQAETPSQPAQSSTAGESSSVVSSAAFPNSSANVSPSSPSPLASSAVPATEPESKTPIASPAPYVSSGNFSAPLASQYKSDSAKHPPKDAPLSLAPTASSTPIVVPQPVTSVKTATLQPTPSAGPSTEPVSDGKASPVAPKEESAPPAIPTEESPPASTPQEAFVSTSETGKDQPVGKFPLPESPSLQSDTVPPSVLESEPTSGKSHDSSISELLNLLEKIIETLRKKLGKERKHARDITRHRRTSD
jgi:hypothetical protein